MGYVRNTYGCHCFYGDSSFKRYNRAHLGGDVIFNFNSGNNITYNMGGGCGGNWFSSLMHGFGAGLGGYFGNMFGGFGMGMGMGNMFGGFGMGNMFSGWGIPSWGSFGNWGLGGGNRTADTPSTGTRTKTDKDNAKINEFDKDADKLLADIKNGTVDKPAEKIDELIKKLDDYKKLDKINTSDNDDQIKIIKDRLEAAKDGLNTKPTLTPTGTKPNGNSTPLATVDEYGYTSAQDAELRALGSTDLTLIKKIAADLNITPSELIKLRKLGCAFFNIGQANNCGKDVYALTLPDAANLTLENLQFIKTITDKGVILCVGYNPDSADKYIAGKLDDLKNEHGCLSYTIDAEIAKSQKVASCGCKYQVTQTQAQGSTYTIQDLTPGGRTEEYQQTTYKDGGGAQLKRTGKPPLVQFK